MGGERHVEGADTRSRFGPKLTLTGRLEGTFHGRPVTFEADEQRLFLRVPDIRTAFMLRRVHASHLHAVPAGMESSGLSLKLQVGSRISMSVWPKPNLLVRLLNLKRGRRDSL